MYAFTSMFKDLAEVLSGLAGKLFPEVSSLN